MMRIVLFPCDCMSQSRGQSLTQQAHFPHSLPHGSNAASANYRAGLNAGTALLPNRWNSDPTP